MIGSNQKKNNLAFRVGRISLFVAREKRNGYIDEI
jgi:hypothetical protein